MKRIVACRLQIGDWGIPRQRHTSPPPVTTLLAFFLLPFSFCLLIFVAQAANHTAIVVKDTDESVKFYRDALGFKVAGESENYDTEQEHLNNVFGARLRITAVHASAGPGSEFLEYLSPGDGRPMPADEKANDLIHWQTRLITQDASAAANSLQARRVAFVSSGVITLPESNLGFQKGFLVRDPDGHVMELIDK